MKSIASLCLICIICQMRNPRVSPKVWNGSILIYLEAQIQEHIVNVSFCLPERKGFPKVSENVVVFPSLVPSRALRLSLPFSQHQNIKKKFKGALE